MYKYRIRTIRCHSQLVAAPLEVLNEIVAVPHLLFEKHAACDMPCDLFSRGPESPQSVVSIDHFLELIGIAFHGSYWYLIVVVASASMNTVGKDWL